MRIVEIREIAVPLSGALANALVSFAEHTVSLVAVVVEPPGGGSAVTGVAFNSIGRFAQGSLLRERVIPRLLSADPEDLVDPSTGWLSPERVSAVARCNEKPGGHGDRAGAVAAVELACWDALAKYHDEPAWRTIARHVGNPTEAGVPVYAAGGYYHPDDLRGRLRAEIGGFLEAGYEAVKIKVGGLSLREDLARIEEALGVLGDPRRLAVDANGALSVTQAMEYAAELGQVGVRWFEEPIAPLDLRGHAELVAACSVPLATGENLFAVDEVRNLLRHGGLRADRDLLQMDAGLSYGLTEYLQMVELAEQAGFARQALVPHGGHLINLHIVTGLSLGGCEAYPGLFAPFGGYSADCRVSDGMIHPGERPGFGLEAKVELAGPLAELVA